MAKNLVNGVDTTALGAIISSFQAHPETAKFEFRSATDWQQGAIVNSTFTGHKRNGVDSTRAKPHQLAGDEPVALLGSGKHVGPAGHLLHAMSHCLSVTTAYHGAARGIKIDSLRVDAEGTLDLQGFLGLSEKVKPGFKQIHLKAYIDSPNSAAEVLELFRYAQGRSPICSTVRHNVDVSWEFEIDAVEGGPDTGDEPVALLGTDAGPSPSETLLHAMANCVSVTTSYHSAARGIPLDAFSVKLEGDMDLQGFADIDDNVTPSYQNIRAKVRIKAGASEDEIAELLKFTTAHSPMCNSVSQPVDISFSLVHNGVAVS